MLVFCFSQSLLGWFDSFTPQQQNTIPLMVFPMVGFIAFQSNNPCWLVAYASLTVFTYKYSSINILQEGWNVWYGGETGYPNLPQQGGDYYKAWEWCNSEEKGCTVGWSACYTVYGNNSFCKLGWAKTITIFSTFNILFTYFTAFGAASWYCEGDGGGGGGGGGGDGRFETQIVSKQPDLKV